MKKIYQNPKLEVIKISTPTIMAGSVEAPNATVDPNEESVDPDKIESRRHNNVWDDAEEEEME